MKSSKTVQLFEYWNRLRGSRPAPRRGEIEPSDIKTLLSDTFILEEDRRGQPIFRLAGTRLCAAYGRELKGFVFPSLWLDKDRRLISRLARNVFDDQTVIVISFDGLSRGGRAAQFEMVILPLCGESDGARALGSVVALDAPYWIGADPILESRMSAVRVVDPEREPLFLANRPEVPIPSIVPAESDLQNAGGQRRVRHLVVLDGGLQD